MSVQTDEWVGTAWEEPTPAATITSDHQATLDRFGEARRDEQEREEWLAEYEAMEEHLRNDPVYQKYGVTYSELDQYQQMEYDLLTNPADSIRHQEEAIDRWATANGHEPRTQEEVAEDTRRYDEIAAEHEAQYAGDPNADWHMLGLDPPTSEYDQDEAEL